VPDERVPDETVVRELSDQVWERALTRDPVAALRHGRQVDALPGGGPDGLAENVSFAAAMLAKLAGRAGLQAAFLRDHLEHELAEEQRFWYRLPVTPYNAMTLGSYRSEIFAAAELRTAHDVDRYLKLLDDYATVVEQMAETMAAQRSRGIRLPRWAVPAAVDTVSGHADASPELLVPRERRAGLAPGPAGRLGDGVTRILHGRLAAAFLRLLDDLAADEHAGGEGVGIGQYPGGADCYAGLIGLTYGYYQPPGADGAGYYHYNVANLPDRPLLQAASVIYHEGLPGHHLQLGRLLENTALHPIRRELTLRTFALNGYLEGWAEYAAAFCDEIGLYAEPADRYGRLSFERFMAARLVVDTGLNVLGWSRERAAAYLHANGFLAEAEIGSELLRYSIDDPGQALGYHLGHWYLRELRGTRDPLEFHEAVLAEGPLPLAILGEHVRSQGAGT